MKYHRSYDRPFTIIQSVAAGQNMSGAAPVTAPTTITNGDQYAESATGVAGLFRFHPRWDLEVLRVTLDLPGDQTTYTVNIIEDGVTTLWATGGAGVTDVILTDRMPLRADGSIQVITTGAPTGVITARVTVRRADHTRIGSGG